MLGISNILIMFIIHCLQWRGSYSRVCGAAQRYFMFNGIVFKASKNTIVNQSFIPK